MIKHLPFDLSQIKSLAKKYPTPFYIYDEKGIKESAGNLIEAFSWAPRFKEYFAVKATPNPHIMSSLKKIGCGMDCSSYPELLLSERVGVTGENIMFSSNNTPALDFQKAFELGAIINLDDITHIDFLKNTTGIPKRLSFRYNPGPLIKGNSIIGHPEEAKFGLTLPQIMEAYKKAKRLGVVRFGIHTMIISNELNERYFIDAADMMFSLVLRIKQELGIELDFVNLGGGLGIPYKPNDRSVNLSIVSKGVRLAYEKYLTANNLRPALFLECGRYITGPHGYLVTQAVHEKHTYRQYIGVDATMADLMRPGMYGAYHHITVMGKAGKPTDHKYDIVGSLCENNDKFAIDRALPKIAMGDILVIHDTGAHGHAMGFNYNGKLRSAELLLKESGVFKLIRRAQTVEDYFSTLV